MPPDGSGDDIAGRKFGTGHVSHETIAVLVDEDRTFAAYRLADELEREGSVVQRRRMELNKLQIGHDRAGACRECEALAKGSGWIRPMQKQTTNAAGRDDDPIGGKKHRPPAGISENTRHRIVFDHQALRRGCLYDRDGRRLAGLAGQGPNDVPAGRVTPGMDDPAARMRGLEAEGYVVAGIPVENDAEPHQLLDRGGRSGEDGGSDGLIAQAVAGDECILQMQRSVVISSDTGSDAALRQHARRFQAQRRAGQEQYRLRRQRERRHQAGEAAADDDGSATGIV